MKDIIYSYRENEFFSKLFSNYKNKTSDIVEGKEVANLLSKSKLDQVIHIYDFRKY